MRDALLLPLELTSLRHGHTMLLVSPLLIGHGRGTSIRRCHCHPDLPSVSGFCTHLAPCYHEWACSDCAGALACRMIVSDMPPRLPRFFTADFEDLVFRMLDKDADRRPSIDELLDLPSVVVRVRIVIALISAVVVLHVL